MTKTEVLNLKLELMMIDYAYAKSDLYDATNKILELKFAIRMLLLEMCSHEGYEENQAVQYAERILG
jgi:hypothetical protein